MSKKQKKNKVEIDFSRLDEKQREFIRSKVERLGSEDKVRAFYRRQDTVSAYALKLARELY